MLDYGSGNLRSVEKALQRGGADTVVTADPETALQAGGLVVPGVGAFAACMTGLRAVRGDQVIDRRLPSSVEAIELVYIPDDSSIQRLRRLLRDERP